MDIQKVKLSDGSLQVLFDGKSLVCPICANEQYDERGSLLNTRSGELFNLAWANDKATNFVCTRCGYIFWFLL